MSRRISDETIRSATSSRRLESLPTQHRVGRPEKQSVWKDIGDTVKETFFPDDPLKSFKDQPLSRKFVLGLRAVFPIFDWGAHYNVSKFKHDLVSGLTVASLCIPQVITTPNTINYYPSFLFSLYQPI